MPEGDTIHQLVGVLRPKMVGETVLGGRLRDQPEASLASRRVDDVFARGKHLFFEFDDGTLLRSHLGMYGSWHRYRRGESWQRPSHQASIVLEMGGSVLVCFNAKEVEVVRKGGVRERQFLSRLGPDLATARVDLDAIVARARGILDPSEIAADVLLDQRLGSGIGNVYKSEVLFLEGVHPRRELRSLADGVLRSLYGRASDLLNKNLSGSRRITRFENDARGIQWVYGRGGQACFQCGGAVQMERLGRTWRSTYWCAECQR